MNSELSRIFEKSWRSTTKVLFGQELEDLPDYAEWLAEYLPPVARRESHVSGKEVIVARDVYPKDANFISADELVLNKNYALTINEIKDIDSVIAAIAEKCEYTGNRVLGNSAFVESSDIVMDSQYVYNSANIEQSSYQYSSYMMRRGSKHCFGTGWTGAAEFCIRAVGAIGLHRCFESHYIEDCSDLYCCFNCTGCHDMLFSFGQRNKTRVIGNLALSREKYAQLKGKLVGEICEKLKADKRFPSLFTLTTDRAPKSLPTMELPAKKHTESMEPIEKSFASACSVLFKRPVGSITALEGWLSEHTVKLEDVKTVFGGKIPFPLNFGMVSGMPKSRLASVEETVELGKVPLPENEITGLDRITQSLGKIAFYTPGWWTGENSNIIKSPIALNSTNVYRGFESTYSENTGLTSLSLHSKYVYGCNRIIESQFCIRCYNSVYLNRCMELDGCIKCADSYFCHNSEALQDAMFCFNMKGRRHVIGNTEFPKEKYLQVKESLLGQMADMLEKKKKLPWDICQIGR